MQHLNKIMAIAFVPAAICACQSLIREDRSDCPATLLFEFTDDQGLGDAELMYLEAFPVLGPETKVTDTTTVGAMAGKSYTLQVRRSDAVSIYGLACFGRSHIVREGRWVVDPGQDGDRLYRFGAQVSGMEESAIVPVELTKEHSYIRVKFKQYDMQKEQGRFPFTVVVAANTCGIDLYSGAPVPGTFQFFPEEKLAGEFEFTVPRQADQSLTLELWDKSGGEAPLDSIVLWTLLKQVEGFSWDMKNLPDLYVEIDYVRSEVTLSISDWQTVTSIHYAI